MQTFAYFDTGHEFPEEIIMAAGFSPYKILGDVQKGTELADEYLFHYFCPFARACLAQAIEDSGNWAGIGFAHGCDATNRQFDVWKTHVKIPFLYWVNTPMKIDGTAHEYYQNELKRFIYKLNEHFDVDINNDSLKEAISISNSIKSSMKELASLRSSKDIPNTEYFEMTRIAVQSPKKEVLTILAHLIKDWRNRDDFPKDKVPVLLTGSDTTYPEWMEILEQSGLRVVRDDLSLGERYFNSLIDEDKDPVAALSEYARSIPQPATRMPSDGRMDYLSQIINETSLRAVVSQNLKFCEPYSIDSVWVVPALKEKGCKVIHLEREYSPVIDHQLLTRLETFKELL